MCGIAGCYLINLVDSFGNPGLSEGAVNNVAQNLYITVAVSSAFLDDIDNRQFLGRVHGYIAAEPAVPAEFTDGAQAARGRDIYHLAHKAAVAVSTEGIPVNIFLLLRGHMITGHIFDGFAGEQLFSMINASIHHHLCKMGIIVERRDRLRRIQKQEVRGTYK